MAKRAKKKQRSRSAAKPVGVQTGRDLLAKGQYKQAIEAFKALKKQDPDGPGDALLSEAYAGRARELFDKGMYREAAAMREQADRLHGVAGDPLFLLTALCNAGSHIKAARLWAELSASGEGPAPLAHAPPVELLAALWVVDDAFAAALPPDHPFARHGIFAREAIEALADDRLDAARQALKQLPVRSPFRSIRLFLQGIIAIKWDPEAVGSILERTPTASPLAPLFQIMARLAAGESLRLETGAYDEAVLETALWLHGVDSAVMELLGKLWRAESEPARLFSLLISQKWADRIPDSLARAICLDLLTNHIKGAPQLVKRFGSLSAWRKHRLAALAEERRRDPHEALEHWRACAGALDDKDCDLPESERAPVRAALFRHMAGLVRDIDLIDQEWEGGWEEEEPSEESQEANYLEKSLDHEPLDREVHLRLIELYRAESRRKALRHALARALVAFPDDPAVLEAAMNDAFSAGAFKKAVRFAGRILERNPINNTVRRKVVAGRLAHARKKFLEGRRDLADKELDHAQAVERPETRDGRIEVCRGVLALLSGEKALGEAQLARAGEAADHEADAALMALMEADRMRAPSRLRKRLEKRLADGLKGVAPQAGMLSRFVTLMESAHREGGLIPNQWLPPLAAWLNKCAKLDLSVDQRLTVCHFLADHKGFPQLAAFARAGISQRPDHPAFLLFDLLAKYKGDAYRVSLSDQRRLEVVLETFTAPLDHHTKDRIEAFLAAGSPFPLGLPIFSGQSGPGRSGPGRSGGADIDPTDPMQLLELLEAGGPNEMRTQAYEAMFLLSAQELIKEMAQDGLKFTPRELKRELMDELAPGFPLGPKVAQRLVDSLVDGVDSSPPAPKRPRKKRPAEPEKNQLALEFDFDD